MDRIVTHNGIFHCDEICALALLELVDIFTSETEIIRTRDPDVINNAPMVIDVGRVYNPKINRFDHHQKEFSMTFNETSKIPLSSCGLIYYHFGKEIITKIALEEFNTKLTKKELDGLHTFLYESIIVSIDANDNGVPYLVNPNTDVNFRYQITLPHIVSSFNREKNNDSEFLNIIELCRKVIFSSFRKSIYNHIQYVKNINMITKCFNNRENQEILVLKEKVNCNRQLKQLDPNINVKFIVLPRTITPPKWQVWTVSKSRFQNHIDLISKEDANDNNIEFVHNNRHIAITHSLESAISISKKSLNKYYGLIPSTKRMITKIKNKTKQNKHIIGGTFLCIAAGFLGYNLKKLDR